LPIEARSDRAKVREIALFPIRAGRLTIGPMKMAFDGRGYPSSGARNAARELVDRISAIEPPLAGARRAIAWATSGISADGDRGAARAPGRRSIQRRRHARGHRQRRSS
jgi:hypothetical protein